MYVYHPDLDIRTHSLFVGHPVLDLCLLTLYLNHLALDPRPHSLYIDHYVLDLRPLTLYVDHSVLDLRLEDHLVYLLVRHSVSQRLHDLPQVGGRDESLPVVKHLHH